MAGRNQTEYTLAVQLQGGEDDGQDGLKIRVKKKNWV